MTNHFFRISLIWAIFASSCLSQTILIDQGNGLWREGSWQDIPANRVVRVVRLDATGEPTPPDDPKPDDSLTSLIASGAKTIDEPVVAESLALGYGVVRGQIERGTATSKAKIVEAQRQANAMLLISSNKPQEWKALLQESWNYMDTLEAAGKINTAKDMAPYWQEIETGLKDSMSAEWKLVTGDDGPELLGRERKITPERRKAIIEMIMKIIFMILGGDFGG